MMAVFRPEAVGATIENNAPAGGSTRLNRDILTQWRDQDGEIRAVKNRSHWERRRTEIVDGLQQVAGTFPSKTLRVPLNPRLVSETDCGDYVRRRILLTAQPGSEFPIHLLVPKANLEGRKRSPGILCLHQTHAKGMDVVVGLGNSPDDEYAVELVRRGYVCAAPPYPLLADYAVTPASLGFSSGVMMAVWNNIRVLDYLDSLSFVRPGRHGTIGHSLGGHTSVFTAVFDPRLRVVVSSCGLDSFEDYMGGNLKGWSSDRYLPALKDYSTATVPFDFQELIGALAPRAVFISAPVGDSNFRWKSVDRIRRAALPIFDLMGAEANLVVVHPEDGHRFPPETRSQAYRFMDRALGWAPPSQSK